MTATIWNNIAVTQVTEEKYEINNIYQYRHDADEVYKPENSHIFDAAAHSRKVVMKALKLAP